MSGCLGFGPPTTNLTAFLPANLWPLDAAPGIPPEIVSWQRGFGKPNAGRAGLLKIGGTVYNGPVTRALPESPSVPSQSDPVIVGAAYCIFAAVGYTVVNICLCALAKTAPLAWTVCVKELVTVVAMGPWVLSRLWRGLPSLPPTKSLVSLIVAGLAVQIVGNLGLIWSLGIVGLSIAIPVALGVSLAISAVLGWIVLGERVSWRSALALAILITSIGLLKFGADQGGDAVAAGPWKVSLAVGMAIVAGFSFASLSVAIRCATITASPPQGIVFIVTGMGVISLGPLSLWQLGPTGLLATPPGHLNLMLLAGTLNLVAFLAITKGLHLTSIVHANVLSASQAAMAAVAGMLWFHEPANWLIVLGIVFTIVSMGLIQRSPDVEEITAGV